MSGEPRQHPWDPQPGEGPEAFEAFRAYLELGPSRTIPAAARAVGKSHQQLYKWSGRRQWVNRAAAWDAERARERDADLRGERLGVRRRLLHRGKEAETISRLLARAGLRPDEYREEVKIPPTGCLGLSARFMRLANECEVQAVQIADPEQSQRSLTDEVFGLDDPALRRVVEGAKRAAPDSGEPDGGDGERDGNRASQAPTGEPGPEHTSSNKEDAQNGTTPSD